MTFNVKNEIKQVQSKIDLLKNQLEQGRSKQMMLCKDESKLKKLVMDRKENLYNLVRIAKNSLFDKSINFSMKHFT